MPRLPDLFAEEHVTVVPGSYLSREVDGFNPGAVRVAWHWLRHDRMR